ncbi:hypothetical protein B0H13DRAFT_1928136 [Mycena leptocephala]|nr:hypothetical protein B0H13DRAFT_1928136 [Mycena leptocephala]
MNKQEQKKLKINDAYKTRIHVQQIRKQKHQEHSSSPDLINLSDPHQPENPLEEILYPDPTLPVNSGSPSQWSIVIPDQFSTSATDDLFSYPTDSEEELVEEHSEFTSSDEEDPPIVRMRQWKTYYRDYKAIAGNMGKNKMEETKIDGYLWLGIHPTLRHELYTSIRTLYPQRDTTKAPTIAQVKVAAEEYFKRDQFPATLLDAREYGYHGLHDTDSESSDSDTGSSTSGESEEEDSDVEKDRKWKKRFKEKLAAKKDKKGKDARGKRIREKSAIEITRDEDRVTKFPKDTNEVEEIIERLNTMNIRDPHYGAVYYKALKMDPLVAHCIQREPLKIIETPPTIFPRQLPPHFDLKPRQTWNIEGGSPATFPNNIPPGERNFNPGCFGCGNPEHRISNCNAIQSLMERGFIRRHPETQRFTMRDGAPIRRQNEETLAQAAERQGRPVSMFWERAPILHDVGTDLENQVMGFYWNSKTPQDKAVRNQELPDIFESDREDDTDTECPSELEEVFDLKVDLNDREWEWENSGMEETHSDTSTDEEDETGYKARQTEKVRTASRPVPVRKQDSEKVQKQTRVSAPDRKKGQEEYIPEQYPYDAREISRKRVEDVVMKDVSNIPENPRARFNALERQEDSIPSLQHKKARQAGNQPAAGRTNLELSENARRAYDSCMKAPVVSTVGEMLGISKELRTLTMDKIKTKIVKAVMLTRDRKTLVAHVPEYPCFRTFMCLQGGDEPTKWQEVRRSEERGAASAENGRHEDEGRRQDRKRKRDKERSALSASGPVCPNKSISVFSISNRPLIQDVAMPTSKSVCGRDNLHNGALTRLKSPSPLNYSSHEPRSSRHSGLPESRDTVECAVDTLLAKTREENSVPSYSPSILPNPSSNKSTQQPGTHLPRFILINGPTDRMNQPQFLCRDTYGSVGLSQGLNNTGKLTAYQSLYNAAAEIRDQYLNGRPIISNPVSLSSAQCTYEGIEKDAFGREGHAFSLINADITGLNPAREEPYSLVGHGKLVLYPPPETASAPWAMEAPYPSRTAIRETLRDFYVPDRPFFAFPAHDTSLRPPLDYLMPVKSTPPDDTPSLPPNFPHAPYCIPALEADAREIGRAINNSAIIHYAGRPAPLYNYIHRTAEEPIDDIDTTWTYLRKSTSGIRTWCRKRVGAEANWRYSHRPQDSVRLVPFDSGVPEPPDIDSDPLTKLPQSIHVPKDITVVQIPDSEDRFSRPVPRYTVPARNEEELARIGRIAADLAQDSNWWKNQRATRRNPPQYVYPRTTTFPSAHLLASRDLGSEGSRAESPPETEEMDEDELEYYGDESDSDSASSDSPPPKPLETSDSYFPPQPLPATTPPRQHRIISHALEENTRRPSRPHPEVEEWDHPPGLVPLSPSSSDLSSRDSGPPADLALISDQENLYGWGNISLSSEESLVSSSSEEDIPLFDSELQYPPSPQPCPVELPRSPSLITPPLRELTLSPPPPDEDSLINLPGTTPISSPKSAPKLLSRFATVALSSAENALRSFTSAVAPDRLNAVNKTFQELERRISNLEKVTSSASVSGATTPQLRDPTLRFPCDEEQVREFPFKNTAILNYKQEARYEAADKLAALLAEHLKEPQIYRAEVEIPTIDTQLLLGFSLGCTNLIPSSFSTSQSLPISSPNSTQYKGSSTYIPYTPCVTPEILPVSDPDLDFTTPIHTTSISPVTDEERKWMDEIFDFDSDCASQDPDSLAASEWLKQEHDQWILKFAEGESFTDDETIWSPPSRRPVRNEGGAVTYDRRRYGWPDYTEEVWEMKDRRYHETLGYTLEFLDHFVLFSQSHFATQLYHNLHLQRFRHTDRRLRREKTVFKQNAELEPDIYPEADSYFTSHSTPESTLENYEGPISYSDSTISWPEELKGINMMTPFFQFIHQVEVEHAARTSLSPVTRSSRYTPIFLPLPTNASTILNSPVGDGDAMPSKRRKTEDTPLGRQVLRAEAFKNTVLAWQNRFPAMRALRGDIYHAILRLIEAIEWLGRRDEFRRIFFPFEEYFQVTTVAEMFRMERERNPDGYFRRNSYHLNSILHDAEVNFLQSCAILFRNHQEFDLAYTLEELLTTRFRDDAGVMHLLREGFLDAPSDDQEAAVNQHYGTLEDRLEEMIDDYTPSEEFQYAH